jgi:hypothetical protein
MLLGNAPTAATVLSNTGWVLMTTGFQFVLWSRLHLVNPGKGFLRTILAFIITNAIIFHGVVIISAIISTIHPSVKLWRVFEAFSFTEIIFTVQELVLTTFYVYYFLEYTQESRRESDTETTLRLLITAEVVVFSVDIVLHVLLYKWRYLPRAMIQPFCSALKLKIEFIILNLLVDFAKSKSHSTALPSWAGQDGTVMSQVNPAIGPPIPNEDDIQDEIGRYLEANR